MRSLNLAHLQAFTLVVALVLRRDKPLARGRREMIRALESLAGRRPAQPPKAAL